MKKSRPYIVLTGDDSVRAEGIILVKRMIEDFADIQIVATKDQQSATGSKVNFGGGSWGTETVDGHEAIWVDGTPTDAVYFAFAHLEKKPDMLISGANIGRNVTNTMHRSGTVSAATCATQSRQTPSIAISLDQPPEGYFKEHSGTLREELLQYPGEMIRSIVKKALNHSFEPGMFWNVNFPLEKTDKVQVVRTCNHDYWVNQQVVNGNTFGYVDTKYNFDPNDDHDVAALSRGYVTITPCVLEYTDTTQMDVLKNLFEAQG